MSTLRITVEWLDGRYHGAEWPPSPWRVYQAMVAGLGRARRREPALEAALRHLEALPAPAVTAPRAAPLRAVRARVPYNDADRVLALHAKGRPAEARAKSAELASLRTRRGRRFEGPVTYDFEASAETRGHLEALVRLAGSVSAVGQGIDLALARAELLEATARPREIRYTPSPDGRLALGVAWVGGFEGLQMRYRRERTRIAGGEVATGIEVSPRIERYRSELELPRVRWMAVSLQTPDDGQLVVDARRGAQVAAMARHADGRIRRALVVAPWFVDEDAWRSVVSRLAGASLVAEAGGGAVGILAPLGGPDPMLARYRGEGRCWTSATPVVLPGWDSRRGRPRPERAAKRLLRHASISEALLDRAAFSRVPRLRGSVHPLSYRRPRHLERYPCLHLTVEWTEPVRGPLSLGGGTGYGLGLFVPVGEEFLKS